jgi:hypothetical protein
MKNGANVRINQSTTEIIKKGLLVGILFHWGDLRYIATTDGTNKTLALQSAGSKIQRENHLTKVKADLSSTIVSVLSGTPAARTQFPGANIDIVKESRAITSTTFHVFELGSLACVVTITPKKQIRIRTLAMFSLDPTIPTLSTMAATI